MKQIILVVLATIAVSACSPRMVDENPQPLIQAPLVFPSAPDQNDLTLIKKDIAWWENFDRPELSALITEAFDTNQGLQAALARIQEARALTTVTSSDLFPKINLEGDYNKDWRGSSEQRANGDVGGSLEWEIDLFARIANATKADRFEAQARINDYHGLRLILSADIASAYFNAAAAKRTISLLETQLKLDKELQDLLELRLKEGIGTNLEVLQQKARVADSKALIPPAESDLRIFENRLDVLLGVMPDAQNRVPKDENLAFKEDLPPIGVPLDLLLNRPDLQALKSELIAADADTAAAISDRFPRITLNGSYAYTDTLAYSGPLAAITSMFVQPLLTWGEKKAEVSRNRAIFQERLANFSQGFLIAVEEVENTLYQENSQRGFIERLDARRNVLQSTVNEAEARYTEGIDDYLEVINALQELREVERQIITEKMELVTIRINLHRAIGGPVKIKS